MSADAGLELLAHELRAPVAALTALAEAAAGSLAPELRVRVVALAIAAGRDIERIVCDPRLDVAAVEEVDVELLVAGIALLDPAWVRVEVEHGLVVHGDPTRLRQLLANLVGNGLRHGTVVTLSAVARGDTLVVDVADDGPGVAPGLDPFLLHASGAGSTGFGLWVARRIAVAHGGSLDLVPDVAGARFRLVLPAPSEPS